MGVVEHMNRTILERARSMQIYAGMPKHLLANVVNAMVYLINRGSSVSLNCGILEEAWTDKKVNLNYRRTFDCFSYVHVELDRRIKLDPKSKRCIFIGYETSEYDYRFWDPENRKILRQNDVVLNEKKMYKDLLMEGSTSKKDPGVASRSTPEQQDVADSEFVELDGVPVKMVRSVLEGNEELRVEPTTS